MTSERNMRLLARWYRLVHTHQSLTGAVRAFPMTWWSAWTSALFSVTLGLVYILSSLDRFGGPTFDAAKTLLAFGYVEPIRLWGTLFLILGVFMVAALRSRVTAASRFLQVGSFIYLFYAVLFFASATQSPTASYGGTLLYLYVAIHHAAASQTIRMIVSLGEIDLDE